MTFDEIIRTRKATVEEIFLELDKLLEKNDNELLEIYPDDYKDLKKRYLGG